MHMYCTEAARLLSTRKGQQYTDFGTCSATALIRTAPAGNSEVAGQAHPPRGAPNPVDRATVLNLTTAAARTMSTRI